MSRRELDRLEDIEESISAIRAHLTRGSLSDGLVFEAVRIRLLEVGEAVKSPPDSLLAAEPSVDRPAIARFRDQLAHHCRDTAHSVLQHVVEVELEELASAVRRLAARARED